MGLFDRILGRQASVDTPEPATAQEFMDVTGLDAEAAWDVTYREYQLNQKAIGENQRIIERLLKQREAIQVEIDRITAMNQAILERGATNRAIVKELSSLTRT